MVLDNVENQNNTLVVEEGAVKQLLNWRYLFPVIIFIGFIYYVTRPDCDRLNFDNNQFSDGSVNISLSKNTKGFCFKNGIFQRVETNISAN